MKKYCNLKVILLTILTVVVCTWIFDGLQFSGELVKGEKVQLGLYDTFGYVADLLRYFPYIVFITLTTGAFYGVAYRIPAYRSLLDSIVEKFKGKEHIFLIAVMVIISAVVSVTGLSLGMLFVFPFIISIVLLMGYNKLVAASVTVGSTMVGLIGTTLGTNSVAYINSALGTTYDQEMITKVILLVLGLIILAFNVISYAKKTKNDTDKVLDCVPTTTSKNVEEKVVKEEIKVAEKAEKVEKKKVDKKNNKKGKTKANDATTDSVKVVKTKAKKVTIWPFILVFDLVFILLAVSTFDWATVTKATWPTDALKAIRDFKINGFPIFDKLILGQTVNEFGKWSLIYEMPITIFLASMFLAFIYGLKFDKFLEGVIDGIRRALKPAIYMTLIYLVLLIVTWHPFQLHFAKFFLGLTKDLNVITMTVVAMISSILNLEPAYVAQSTLPYVTSVVTDTTQYPIISVMFQSVYGLTMLIAPTSVILIGTLTYLDVPYTQWIKHIWKLFLELLLVLIVVFLVLVLI